MSLRPLLAALLLLPFSASVFAESPEFSLTDAVSGKHYQLEDWRGKWVVVNYWATWCPPCLEEIPELVLFHENHQDKDAFVVGINMETLPDEKLVGFAEEHFISYPVSVRKSEQQMIGQVPGLPTTYLIDPEGNIVARQVGRVTSDSLENFISSYKKQAGL